MELLAVRTARLIAHINAEELNPLGRPIAHDFFNEFTARYSFLKRPMTADEILDPQNKGVTFEVGKFDNVGIDKITLFDWAVAIETSASTDACEAILQDALNWGAERFGLSNRPSLVTQRNYVSELVFTSDLSLPSVNKEIHSLGGRITELVSGYLGQSLPYEMTGFGVGFDPTASKQIYTPFTLYRLVETPFTQQKYYSGAPLKTSDHQLILGDLERILGAE